MTLALVRHTFRSQRIRLLAVSAGLFGWGLLGPIIYANFGSTLRELFDSGLFPESLANFGGGDIFSLPGSIALGVIHPIALVLVSVFAVGFSTAAIAGERQRGTLEVLLSRPRSRRAVYVTLLVTTLVMIAIAITALLAGALLSSTIVGVIDEIDLANVPLAGLNAMFMYGSFAAIGLAASVSFDRLPPALGVTLAILLVSYFLEILGSLWPDAAFLQPYSLFHYLQTRDILNGAPDPFAFLILGVVAVVAIGWALVVFPRRDLAAPS